MSAPRSLTDPLFLSFQSAVAGRYSIEREIGRGGMGIVYLAREVHLDRSVAIKLLPPNTARDTTLRERFLREARLAAKLSHPNIIPIHAVEETGGFVFYVMAYVDGETLAHRVRTRGPLAASEGARVLREVAWALAHAHAQGLVHRDVKPDNILLESASGRVLVADFGIAAASAQSAAEGVSGTPEFMSPEQALGKPLDARSDLYSVGATAFYAFTGRLPFEGRSATEVLAKQVTEQATPLATMGVAVPRKLAAIVDRCLAKEPERRPASADALAEQLSVAMEQRREMPVALRAFVKHNARLDSGGTLIFPVAVLLVSGAATGYFGMSAGVATFAAGMAAGPLAYFVHAARRIVRLGFSHADIGPAFQAEIDQAREERALEHGREPSQLERVFSLTSRVSGVAFAIASAVQLVVGRSGPPWTAWIIVSNLVALSGVVFGPATLGWLFMLQRRRDLDTELWSRFWRGRAGRFIFAIARRLVPNQALGSAMTHRATELSLGLAAENLYASLSKEMRQALAGLPQLLTRLQDDAQRLRRRYDQLQDALSTAGDAGTTDTYASLRDERDAVQAKLREAVGALETIRLNLLRLHAGSGSVEGLTTHIGLAAEVSAEVERLLSAQHEIDRELELPRRNTHTPV